MNASDFKLPPAIATHTVLDPLESLHSPNVNQSFERDSIAGSEFNDIALDDDSYSSVPLTAIPESHSPQPPDEDDITTASRPRIRSLSLTLQNLRLSTPPKSHRKTASTTTIRSTHESNRPSLVTRLDFQEHNGKVARASLDGQMELQKEFARLQEKETKDHNQTESSIDWGEY
jgi:ecotropic viral integration site 5 protein